MRTILAGLVILIVAGITSTWFWTIPQCLTSGWGTPGYWGTARSVTDDDGVFGCWYARVTKERVRAHRHSRSGRATVNIWNATAAPSKAAGIERRIKAA